ncbi:hypothetical protein HYR69_12010 [Candidatus Sumerlaeota bacterium]|nr:hypothetical protein [Candidatus Sumerlaeota bacterium]
MRLQELADRYFMVYEKVSQAKTEEEAFEFLFECLPIPDEICHLLCTTPIPVVKGEGQIALVRAIASGKPHPVERGLKNISQMLRKASGITGDLKKALEELEGKLKPAIDLDRVIATFLGWPEDFEVSEDPAHAIWNYMYPFIEKQAMALAESGCLVLGEHPIPQFMEMYVMEARQCYAAGNYLAMFIVARTILQLALTDISVKRSGECPGRWTEFSESLEEMINRLYPKAQYFNLNDQMHKFRKDANNLAHPSNPKKVEGSKEKATAALKNLLGILGRAYAEEEKRQK